MGTKKIGDLITDNMGVYEGKTKLSFGKLVLLGMLAGAFIAIGASSSSAAVYGISNTGIAKSGRCNLPGGIDVRCADRCRTVHGRLPDVICCF